MKRILLFALTLTLLLGLLSGCGHTHEWKDATCEAPKTCASCEETEGEALGHKISEMLPLDASGKLTRMCPRCHQRSDEVYELETFVTEYIVGTWNIVLDAADFEGSAAEYYIAYTNLPKDAAEEVMADANIVFAADGTLAMTRGGATEAGTWEYDKMVQNDSQIATGFMASNFRYNVTVGGKSFPVLVPVATFGMFTFQETPDQYPTVCKRVEA